MLFLTLLNDSGHEQDIRIFQQCLLFLTDEGTFWGDTSRFHSFISHLVKYIEIVKTLKGIFPNRIPSKDRAILLEF